MQQTIKCPHCGDPIVLVAAVADPQAVERSGRQKGQASAEIPIREEPREDTAGS